MKNQIRRYSQILFFILFVVLLVQTEYKGTDQLGQPVRFFLGLDPLIATAVLLAAKGIFFYVIGVALTIGIFIGVGWIVKKLAAQAEWASMAEPILTRYLPLGMILFAFTWAIFPFGIERGWALVMAFGVLTVAVTLLIGRVFCGWVCPMGAVLQFTSWLKKEKRSRRIEKNQYKPHQRWKYYLLFGLLIAALLGFQVVGLVDPISSIIRSFSLVISPLVNIAANSAVDIAYETDNDIIIDLTEGLYGTVAYPNVLSFHQPHFMGVLLVAAFFIFLLAMCFRRPRYWCRVLCPLGALLGLVSRNTPYRLQMRSAQCSGCGNCSLNCQGACDPEFREGWRPAECFVCFHCVDSCPSDALKFSFRDIENEGEEKKQIGLDIKKRRVFHAVGAALVAVPLIKATEQYKQDVGGAAEGPALHNPLLIRPPGAVDESEFLQRCIRCAECMKVCPTNGLQPATLEAGIEGMWTPILVPRIGYCEYYCTLCGQVCPTGAIQQLDVDTKIKTIIGTAFFDFNRCLPYAFGVDCIVCEEHCPTSPKAIWFERERRSVRGEAESLAAQTDPYGSGDEQVWLSPTEQAPADDAADEYDAYESQDYSDPYGSVGSGDPEYVLKPKIDLDLCIGCGICEKVCVVADKPAVYITAVGESRSNTNRITFEGSYEGY